jgi:hypothetical protein
LTALRSGEQRWRARYGRQLSIVVGKSLRTSIEDISLTKIQVLAREYPQGLLIALVVGILSESGAGWLHKKLAPMFRKSAAETAQDNEFALSHQ